MTEIITFGCSDRSGPGASVSKAKAAPGSKIKSTGWPPTVIYAQGSSGVIRVGACVVTPGIFGPDCPESPTPGACTLEGSLFSSVVLCRPDMEPGVA